MVALGVDHLELAYQVEFEQRPLPEPVHAVLVQQPVSIWEIGGLERHAAVVAEYLPCRPRRQLLQL